MRNILADTLSLWERFRDYVTLALLGISLLLGAMYYVTNLRLEACESNTLAIVESTRAAQAEAEVKAIEDRNRIEEEYRNYAAEQDEAYRSLLGRYSASLVRYADRGQASRSAAAPSGGGTGSTDATSEGTVLSDDVIVIPFSDAEICAENTARLQIARDWALGLQEIK